MTKEKFEKMLKEYGEQMMISFYINKTYKFNPSQLKKLGIEEDKNIRLKPDKKENSQYETNNK